MNSSQGQFHQRAGPLAGLPALVSEMGGNLEEVFAGTGLTPGNLEPGRYLSVALFVTLLERAVIATGRPDFALQLGLRQMPSSLGALGKLMALAPTLGDALADFVSFQISNSRGAAAYLHRMGDDFAFGIGIYDRGNPASSLPYDLSIAIGCNLIRQLTGVRLDPLEILLIRRPPDDPVPYRAMAHCPVRFNEPQCCMILSRQQLGHALPTADPAARAAMLVDLHEVLSRAPWGVAGQVRHALRPALLQGLDSLHSVAQAIGLHHRTLERNLKEEGTRFDALRDEVRFTLAKELLALTSLPIGEVGASLSYASHSSFIHAFQRWSGTTPTKWRQHILATTAGFKLPLAAAAPGPATG